MSKWVSVGIAVPEDGQEVLAIIDGIVRIAKYEYGCFHYDFEWVDGAEYNALALNSNDPKISRWRPLPSADVE